MGEQQQPDIIDAMAKALRPFAECADMLEIQKVDVPDERMLMFASEGGGTFLGYATVADLRKARAVLQLARGEKGDV